jgi:hypothetical protein
MEVRRSEIRFSDYNPRTITDEAKKTLKKGIRRYGLLGGIIVNRTTGMTIVSGHQRVAVMDELNKYDAATKENDYRLRVDVIEVSEQDEKQLNILLNNPNAQGQWDYDLMREIIPGIDCEAAGLTAEDLNIIGVDFTMKTEEESAIADALNEVTAPVDAAKEAEKQAKAEMTSEQKIAHNKNVKGQILDKAEEKAENMEAYVMLTFDTIKAKASFMERFGFDKEGKFIKGEAFSDMIERVE